MKQVYRHYLTLLVLLFLASGLKAQQPNPYTEMRGSPEDSLKTDDFTGAWKIPDTDFFLKFGGYFRLDAIYDFTGSGSRNQLLMNQIYAENTPEAAAGPFFNMHVRETRFNFDLRRTTDKGRTMKFFLEFDFFDESLSPGQPRLRHAFVKYGKWTLGQTWTNLSDLRVFPFIMDFSAGDALFGGRTIQVRYEHKFSKQWQMGLAFEMPSLNGIYNPFEITGVYQPVLPVFSARISNERDNGMITLGGQIEQLRWDGLKQSPNATTAGWGLVLNGRQSITNDFFVTWHSSYNSGITSQILIFAGTDEGAVILPSGSIEKEDAITLALGCGYAISSSFSTNLALAYMDRGNLDYRSDHTLQEGIMGHFNLVWKLDEHVMTGIEYAWGDIRNVDKAKGEAHRIQTMVRYAF